MANAFRTFSPFAAACAIRCVRLARELFDTAFADAAIVRHEIPYADAALPAYSLPAAGTPTGDTVLLHGGFDSLIEEFFPICQRVAAAGFDVIVFEDPGQGGARTLNGLTFNHDRESRSGRCWTTSASIGPRSPVRMMVQPPALLTATRSVTTRMFTRAEQADQHCQMVNLELACGILTTWLQAAGTDAGASSQE